MIQDTNEGKPEIPILGIKGNHSITTVMKKIRNTWSEKQGHGEHGTKEEHSETPDELFLHGTARKCPEIGRDVCSKMGSAPWL